MRRALTSLALLVASCIAAVSQIASSGPPVSNYYQPLTRNYLARSAGLAGTTTTGQLALDNLVSCGNAGGWLPAMQQAGDAFYVVGATATQSLLNLVGPSYSAATTPTAPSFLPYTAFATDGSASWINPGVTWSQIAKGNPNAFYFWEYVTADHAVTAPEYGSVGGGSTLGLRSRSGKVAQVNSFSSTVDTVPVISGTGFLGSFRNDPNSYVIDKNGSETTITRASGVFPTVPPAIGRFGTTGATFVSVPMGAYGFGTSAAILSTPALRQSMSTCLDAYFLATGAVQQSDFQGEQISLPNVFGPTAINTVVPAGLGVIQEAGPPSASDTNNTYSNFPISAAWSFNTSQLVASTNTSVKNIAAIWALRANVGPGAKLQANPIFPLIYTSDFHKCGREYSSYTFAIGATLAEEAYQAGYPQHNAALTGYGDIWAAAGGSDATTTAYATVAANPDTTCTGTPTNGNNAQKTIPVNTLVLPNAQASSGSIYPDVGFDYEVADGRVSATTLGFFQQAGNIARNAPGGGMKVHVYINALNSTNAAAQGFDTTSVPGITNAIDFFSIVGTNINITPQQSMRQLLMNQAAFWPQGPPMAKLEFILGIGPYRSEVSTADAQIFANIVRGTDTMSGSFVVPPCSADCGLYPAPPGSIVSGTLNASGTPAAAIHIWRNNGNPGGASTRQFNITESTATGAAFQ